MQISKTLLVVCVAAALGAVPQSRGDDSPAIAQARAALRQKMKELDSQSAPVEAPASAATQSVARSNDSEAIAKAREALRQQMKQLDSQGAQAPSARGFSAVPPPSSAAASPSVAAVSATLPAADKRFSPLPPASPSSTLGVLAAAPPSDKNFSPLPPPSPAPPPGVLADAAAKAREELAAANRAKEIRLAAELNARQQKEKAPPTVTEAKPTVDQAAAKAKEDRLAAEAKARQNKEKANRILSETKAKTDVAAAQPQPKAQPAVKPVRKLAMAFQPLEAPALPISSDKAARLVELLQKYKVDAITPQQYHEQRARILAEP